MDAMTQLLPKLKLLRLSGILSTLEVRNQQAILEKCTHVEFLERLLEDEIERRNQKQFSLRLRRSGLDPTKTLEAFNLEFNAAVNRQQVYDLALPLPHKSYWTFVMARPPWFRRPSDNHRP